jgi:hypothetical protein
MVRRHDCCESLRPPKLGAQLTKIYREGLKPLGIPVAVYAKTIWTSECFFSGNIYLELTRDSLHQFLNGWILNIDAYSNGLGTWHNLRVCPGRH